MSLRKTFIIFLLLAPFLFAKETTSDEKAVMDAMLINGIYAKEIGETQLAQEFFQQAYAIEPSSALSYETASLMIRNKKYYEAIQEIESSVKRFGETEESDRLLITAYLHLGDVKNAEIYAQKLLDKNHSVQNLNIAASVYFGAKNYVKAASLFEEAYSIDQNEGSLLKLTDTYYHFLGQKEKAIRLLRSRIKLAGCNYEVCKKLITYLQQEKKVDEMGDIYKDLYETYKVDKFATAAAELYILNKQNDKAIEILSQSGADNLLLLDVYQYEKQYDKALTIATALYKKTNDPKVLAQIALIEYEKAKDKNDKAMLRSVENKLKIATEKLDDDTIDNFYGYLLIDHDIDPTKGITYVKKALEKDPESPYYLDSLAWGYYKLGECKKAMDPMERAYNQLKEEKEIQEHYQAIKKCIRSQK